MHPNECNIQFTPSLNKLSICRTTVKDMSISTTQYYAHG